jgi:hypothetical protein
MATWKRSGERAEGALAAGGTESPGRRSALRAVLLTGATAAGAIALSGHPASASSNPYVVTDPLTNSTCILPSGDTTGETDATNINDALAANLSGQNVVLAAGLFYVNAPVMIPPGGVLKGQFANENTEISVHAWGSCISAVTSVAFPWVPASIAGGTVNAVVACIGQQAGGYPYSGDETKVYGVMIDCSALKNAQLPGYSYTDVDGLQVFGGVSRPHFERVLIAYAPNCGFNMVNDGYGNGADAVRLERVNVRYPGGYGFNHPRTSDCTYYDCLCENGGTDGFYIEDGSNCTWTACRSEHNGGNGYTYLSVSVSTGTGGAKLVGCSTDRNEAQGIYITSFDSQQYGGPPLTLSGCAFRRDGRQGGSGGGDFAGIDVYRYAGPVLVSGCNVWPGVDDGGSGTPSPNYGIRLSDNTSTTQIIVGASYIQGASTFLSDDGTTPDIRWGQDVAGAYGPTSSPTLRQPRMGTGTLSGGQATITSNCVEANSIIQLTQGFVNGGTQGILRVSGRNAGTSFDVTSSSGNDVSSFYWQIMNP